MNSIQLVQFHWYDVQSKEGFFKDASGCNIYANFEFDNISHLIASQLRRGMSVSAEIVQDTTFRQIKAIELK